MKSTGPETDIQHLAAWEGALARKAGELRAEISAKQAELAQIEERLGLVRRLLEIEARDTATSPGGTTSSCVIAGNSSEDAPVALETVIEKVLREAGKPLHISDIRQALLDRRVPIPGRGDEANIIVRLRRLEHQFTRTARGTYGLAEWGLPALSNITRKHRRRVISK